MLIAYLLLGAILFVLGLVGFVTRRNLIIIFLCTEMIFQGIILTATALGRYPISGRPTFDGQVFGIFVIVLAAAEAAIALAIVLAIFRGFRTIDTNTTATLKQ